jgi:hypothetical protein
VRVIFLDVDGVLNSETFLRKLDDQHRQLGQAEPSNSKHEAPCECYRLELLIDRDAVSRLNRLVVETGAKIVVSSSWRKHLDPHELHRVLVEHGLVAEIIGETPDGPNDPEMRAELGYSDRIFRGHEIDAWLRKHPEVDRFVILDDGSDMEMHENRLVQTDAEEGLLDDHVEQAIRVMSWDGKTIQPLAVEFRYGGSRRRIARMAIDGTRSVDTLFRRLASRSRSHKSLVLDTRRSYSQLLMANGTSMVRVCRAKRRSRPMRRTLQLASGSASGSSEV